MEKNIVLVKSKRFAIKSIDLYKSLRDKKEYVFSKQFIRSATSIGANIHEAIAAESRKDFIHKMSIAHKEVREVTYWIELIEYAKFSDYNLVELKNDAIEITKILSAIIKTTRSKLNT